MKNSPARDARAFLESEVENALTELGYANRALQEGLNGLALGVADRRARPEIP